MLRRFGKYRIAATHSNAAFKIPFEGSQLFFKVYGPKYPRIPYELRKLLNIMGVRQPVEYRSPRKRKIFEEETLNHWRDCGYPVPAVRDNPFAKNEFGGLSILTTDFIKGVTLREMIHDETIDWPAKGEKLQALFREVSRRHTHAFELGDVRLFHVDANSRNIIFAGDSIYHCDFEMGRPWEPPVACATREILKMLVSVADDAESEKKKAIFDLFKSCYRNEKVYEAIKKGITGRPFQRLHLYRDRRKKKREPYRTTLYDILRYFS